MISPDIAADAPPARLESALRWAYTAFLLAATLVFFTLSLYSHPAADDFSFARRVQQESLPEFVISIYHGWSGRFTAYAFNWIGYHAIDLTRTYWIAPLAAQVCLLGALYLVCRQTPILHRNRTGALFYSSFLFVLFTCGMPHPREAYYWANAAFAYTVPLATFLISVASLLASERGGRLKSMLLLMGWTGCLLSGAMNEIFSCCAGAVLFVAVLLAPPSSSTDAPGPSPWACSSSARWSWSWRPAMPHAPAAPTWPRFPCCWPEPLFTVWTS